MQEPDRKTLVECSASVQAGKIVVGGEEVEFTSAGVEKLGRDGFSVTRSKEKARVTAASSVARFSALLELADMQESGRKKLARKLRFGTRNYKHELRFSPDGERSILRYTEEFWGAVCRELVRRHFNGIVFYVGYGAFESFLDYDEFGEAVRSSAEERARFRDAVIMILRVSKRYGLRTLMQHYVTHTPPALADALKLPFHAQKAAGGRRLSAIEHARIYDYWRYVYRRTFQLCSDLDGFYMNYESAPNCARFVKSVVLPTLSALERKPVLFHRLWDFVVPHEMCEIIETYPGETLLGHKVMDTSDCYYYPCADSRVMEWKEVLAKRGLDVEWCFLFGPCHNCGTNISRAMWSDPEFVYGTLADALKKGSDGISFNTVVELVSDEFDCEGIIPAGERERARLNHFHLECAVDFFRGGRFDEKRVVEEHARHFGLKAAEARVAYKALRDSSRAVLLPFQQFYVGSAHEGFSVKARRSLTQEPFFYLPANWLNSQDRWDTHTSWCWLDRSKKARVCPEDLQLVIDCVDPAKKKSKRNPEVIARELEKLGGGALRAAKSVARKMGEAFVAAAEVNYHFAMRVHHDIRAGLEGYALYFPKSKADALKHLARAAEELKGLEEHMPDPKKARLRGGTSLPLTDSYGPDLDIAGLKRLERSMKKDFSFKAFREFTRSKALYNEIRRHVRPWRIYSDRTMKKAEGLLKKSLAAAKKAKKLCSATRFEANVEKWAGHLERELGWLAPPEIVCRDASSAGTATEEQAAEEMQQLVHDQCFGYGNVFWEDFSAFFEPMEFYEGEHISIGLRRENDALVVHIREENCDMAHYLSQWDAYDGAADEMGFVRLFFDPEARGEHILLFHVLFRGKDVVVRDLRFRGRQDSITGPVRLAERWQARFTPEEKGWDLEIKLPFDEIGAHPEPGDVWLFNAACNTPVARNHGMSWCEGYEVGGGNPSRMGRLVFA